MNRPLLWTGLVAALACACSKDRTHADTASSAAPAARPGTDAVQSLGPIALPGGAPGIGFDDLRFAAKLGRILAPGGRSGSVYAVDPGTLAVTAWTGFSTTSAYAGGHDDGPTSADDGGGLVYVTDRTSKRLSVVDPARNAIVGSAELGASPDYVRFVAPRGELWVTEPDAERIEVFTLSGTTPSHSANIAVRGGPESLVIDVARGRAYTHLWSGATVAVDLASRSVVATWKNGCEGSRGIALDPERGWVFVGCAEGKAVALDPARGGAILSSVDVGPGVDVIDYRSELAHLYVPSSKSAAMAIVGVASDGKLSVLASVPTVVGAHCVAADAQRHAFVCDPGGGRLLAYRDEAASAR